MNLTKQIVIILVVMFLSGLHTNAQRKGATGGIGLDYTVGGRFLVANLGVELNRHTFGLMHESRIVHKNNVYNPEYYITGLFYDFVFYRERKLQLSVLLRGGIANDDFLFILPGLTTSFVLNDYIKFSTTACLRGEFAAVSLNTYFNLPFKEK